MVDGDAIRLQGLSKHFGPIRALDRVDLEVQRGEVFGFLGPNGAGKSTAIRILMDLIRPTAGYAEVLGQRPDHGGTELRSRIGYLPGELRLPEHTTAGRYLHYLTKLRDNCGTDGINDLAERFDLDLSRTIGKLSKGNKQKIGVVQAFMHQPELLILDEPTSGLDPLLQHEFRDLVQERCAEGATLFMSSHVLGEIEATVERVAIIRAGQLVDIDDLATLRHRAGQEIELRFAHAVSADAFDGISNLSDLSVTPEPEGGATLRCILRGEPDQLLKAAAGHHVTAWKADDRELEDLFLDFYRPAGTEDGLPTATEGD
jgi:ABC-2 type transport system ATP-binding protein